MPEYEHFVAMRYVQWRSYRLLFCGAIIFFGRPVDRYTNSATISARERLAVRPGLSIPNRFTRPVIP